MIRADPGMALIPLPRLSTTSQFAMTGLLPPGRRIPPPPSAQFSAWPRVTTTPSSTAVVVPPGVASGDTVTAWQELSVVWLGTPISPERMVR